jgi:hypothetical protein
VNGAEATEEPRRLRPDHEKGHSNDRQRGYRAPMEGRARIAQMPCTTKSSLGCLRQKPISALNSARIAGDVKPKRFQNFFLKNC